MAWNYEHWPHKLQQLKEKKNSNMLVIYMIHLMLSGKKIENVPFKDTNTVILPSLAIWQ